MDIIELPHPSLQEHFPAKARALIVKPDRPTELTDGQTKQFPLQLFVFFKQQHQQRQHKKEVIIINAIECQQFLLGSFFLLQGITGNSSSSCGGNGGRVINQTGSLFQQRQWFFFALLCLPARSWALETKILFRSILCRWKAWRIYDEEEEEEKE